MSVRIIEKNKLTLYERKRVDQQTYLMAYYQLENTKE